MNQSAIVVQQRKFFNARNTLKRSFRLKRLTAFKKAILAKEKAIIKALNKDLGKPEFEGYCEVGIILEEIQHAISNLKQWAAPEGCKSPLVDFPARAYHFPAPYGVSLIMGPWNYPFLLTLCPLVGAVAAGNCAVVRPSSRAKASSAVIAQLLGRAFQKEHVAALPGTRASGERLLKLRFDKIFFTGSPAMGKVILRAAAEHVTPVTLELGGKNPCIADEDIDIEVAARRIAWGKFFNAGQSCVAPDYLLVHKQVKDELVKQLQQCIQTFFGINPARSPDFGRIINAANVARLADLLNGVNILVGGQTDLKKRYCAPTLVDNPSWDKPIMQEEIFGPILPILEFDRIEQVISLLKDKPSPLSLYIFSKRQKFCDKITSEVQFGGGCINDTVLQFIGPHLPFGGVGESGMGKYHGKASFDAFSYRKSILKKGFRMDIPLRYPPLGSKVNLLRKFLG